MMTQRRGSHSRTGSRELRVTTLGEFVRAFYEAALEDEMTWSDEEAWSLTLLALGDYFRRHPRTIAFA